MNYLAILNENSGQLWTGSRFGGGAAPRLWSRMVDAQYRLDELKAFQRSRDHEYWSYMKFKYNDVLTIREVEVKVCDVSK